MASTLRNRRWFRILSHLCRITFAITFIISGFFKAIDPWGTVMNINNYQAAYGIEAPEWLVLIFSIWLCGAELMMGCMLLFKVRIRLVSIFSVLSMCFFTLLTFLSVTFIPVEDCGCFGEFVKLTPMATFLKNLVLLPMAFCFWWRYRPDRIFSFSKLEFALMLFFFTMSMSVGAYSYLHLPPIDLLPYKEGVNIAEEMQRARAKRDTDDVVLVYRNRRTGRLREFSLADRAWHNEKRWEWVETRVGDAEHSRVEPMILEFHLSEAQVDKTDSLLSLPGRMYMLCVADLRNIGEACVSRMARVVERAEREGSNVICLTPEYFDAEHYHSFANSSPVPCYNIDAKTMKTMLRANSGLVELLDGTIVNKLNCRDIEY